ncbi:ABC transporter ATP-binding protein [Okibacterium endophyticum]
MNDNNPLLEIDHLGVDLPGVARDARVVVINDVSLTIHEGESVGLVGESGSGKSMTTRAVMRLLPEGARARGRLDYQGRDLAKLKGKALARFRAKNVGMIFQDPRAHINPLWTLGHFLVESVVETGEMTREAAEKRAVQLLDEVGIPDGARRLKQYPHQLSGGLLQRVMIVMALMPSPQLLLADEPTTALDVTVQSEVMAILNELRIQHGLGMLFITHDLDLAAAVTDTLAVMYAGVIVERGPSPAVYHTPRHPYTAGLLGSRPSATAVKELTAIPGKPMGAFEVGPGCVFEKRCPFATDYCRDVRPELREVEDGRWVACHQAEEIVNELKGAEA